MLYVMVLRVVAGFALLGMLGVVIALATQMLGMEILDRRLEARDHRKFKEQGWPKLSDFPVVGQPGWQDQLHRMMYPKRKNRS